MKTIVILILIAGLGLGGLYLFLNPNEDPQPTNIEPEPTDNEALEKASISDLNFSYKKSPDDYMLVPGHTSWPEYIVSSVTLFNEKEFTEFERMEITSEYPPSITISVFENESELTSLEWAEANPLASNIELNAGEVSAVSQGGVEGVTYTVSGLYMIDIYLFAHNQQIYLIYGEYNHSDDQIHKDFNELIKTIGFSN